MQLSRHLRPNQIYKPDWSDKSLNSLETGPYRKGFNCYKMKMKMVQKGYTNFLKMYLTKYIHIFLLLITSQVNFNIRLNIGI